MSNPRSGIRYWRIFVLTAIIVFYCYHSDTEEGRSSYWRDQFGSHVHFVKECTPFNKMGSDKIRTGLVSSPGDPPNFVGYLSSVARVRCAFEVHDWFYFASARLNVLVFLRTRMSKPSWEYACTSSYVYMLQGLDLSTDSYVEL